MANNIKHIWFDFEGTLTPRTPELIKVHNKLRYKTYAEVVKKPNNKKLREEYKTLYKKYGSNSAVFRSLGFPSDYWQRHMDTLDEAKYFKPDIRVYKILEQLKNVIPISLFTNAKSVRCLRILRVINVDPKWFTYILSGDDVKERKPALDGFYDMIKKSKLPPEKILYVGDRINADIKPARAVGMKTCLVWGKSDEADFSFKNFKDIYKIIT